MKIHLMVTGRIFGLIGITHVMRLFVEGERVFAHDAGLIATTGAIFVVGIAVATWPRCCCLASGANRLELCAQLSTQVAS